MAIRIPFTNIELRKVSKQDISNVSAWTSGGGAFLQSRKYPMLLSTVYRCVDLISDSVAVLPLETFKLDSEGFKTRYTAHPAYDLLNLEPNENMTRYVFFKTLMASVLLTGNGYAYIERDNKLRLLQLVYIPSSQVTIVWITDGKGIRRKRYQVSGWKDLVPPSDMIHVLNFSYDGIIGVSTLTHAAQTLNIATCSEEHAAGFFKGGGSMSGILKQIAGTRLNNEQKDQIYKTWEDRINPVSGRPNGIMIIEANYDYQPISISPKDSQLLESRLFNVQDLCRFFSVSPVKAFDLSKSSYSTVEATQLEYLTDTALAVITKIELEINRKVFLPSERSTIKAEFNTAAILRTDKVTQATYYKELSYVAGITPNETRRELGYSRVEYGDEPFIQVNMQTLKRAVTDPANVPEEEKKKEKEKVSDTSVVSEKKV